jgi:hypothetical protein
MKSLAIIKVMSCFERPLDRYEVYELSRVPSISFSSSVRVGFNSINRSDMSPERKEEYGELGS